MVLEFVLNVNRVGPFMLIQRTEVFASVSKLEMVIIIMSHGKVESKDVYTKTTSMKNL